MSLSAPNEGPRRLPLTVELGIVTSLGFVAYFAPQIPYAMQTTARIIGPPLNRFYLIVSNSIAHRWAPYSRRLKTGSIIRVIGSILPDFVFEPTGRIFISGLPPNVNDITRNNLNNGWKVWGPEDDVDTVTARGRTFTTISVENDHQQEQEVIVAFQLDSAGSDCHSDISDFDHESEDDIEEEVSSNPEGWEQNNFSIPCFHPGASSTRVLACSTPTQQVNTLMNDSFGTEITDCDENNGKTQEEIAGLKLMIQQLMQQMNALNENMSIRHNQTEFHPQQQEQLVNGISTNDSIVDFPPPPPPLPSAVNKPSSGPPGPPPPPPPPMPAMVFQGSVKLQPLKKSKQNDEPTSKPVPSMFDILKDLPNVKLRSVQRSPGGTPVKKGPKYDDKGSLEFVLKKRFESLHSPHNSDNEEDKENGFDDSILTNDSPQLENKFKCSRPNFANKTKKSFGNRKSIGESQPLFGPHLLKKRIQAPTSPSPKVLGIKNTNSYV